MRTIKFIARRYLFSKKHISLISTLTLISIIGVTIGTALLIVVLSVFNGFFEVIQGILLQDDPDIRIESAEKKLFLYSEDMQEELEGIPEITELAPYVSGKVLLVEGNKQNEIVDVMGVEVTEYAAINSLDEKITIGSLDLEVKNKRPGLIVDQSLMNKLNLRTGDTVALLSASGMQKSLTQFSLPRQYRFEVRGAYTAAQITDGSAIFIDRKAAQRLFESNHHIAGIDLRLTDSEKADAVKSKISAAIGGNYTVSTWYDLQKPLYDIMYLEKWSSYLILMIIVLVAVLNIIGSLTMIVIQKNRDIGVLLTMGFTPRGIKRIFMQQGLYIGLIGCGIGGGLGLLLSWLQQQYGLIKLSSAFIIDAYPVNIEAVDVAIILMGSLILCLLASWYPSRRAATVQPAEAIRYD